MQTPPRLKLPQWESLAAIGSTFGPASLLYFLKMISYLLMQALPSFFPPVIDVALLCYALHAQPALESPASSQHRP